MAKIHPSIMNHIRRDALAKDPERNIIPIPPTPETSELEPELPTPTTMMGRLALKLNWASGTEET